MSRELDLRDVFRIILKRMWLIALIVVLTCSLALWYSLFVKKPVYVASTKIVVNQTPSPSAANQLDLNQIHMNIQLISTYKEIIKTPAILDEVAANYPELQLNADQLSRMINVNSVNNTQVMTVVVRDTTYLRAAEIANAVSDVFQQEIPKIFNVENVSILNEAKTNPPVEPGPVEPNIMMNMLIAFVVSLMIGVGLSLLLEYLDDTIKTEEDVKEYLGLPTLAMITRVSKQELTTKAPPHAKTTQVHTGGENNHVEVAAKS